MDDLRGKVAFITGGANGIGLGMARAFAAEGMKLVLADIDEQGLSQAESSLTGSGADVLTLRLDVTDRAGWAAAADRAEDRFGAIHVACNNAGIQAMGWDTDQLPVELWDLVVGINLTGVFNGIHTLVPRLKKQAGANKNGWGHVVNTASISGLRSVGGHAPYIATKHAVVGLSDTLRQELKEHGIGVSVLCPGVVQSELKSRSKAVRAAVGAAEEPKAVKTVPGKDPIIHDPLETGRRVVAAIRANELFIITHAEFRPVVEERHRQVMKAFEQAR